MTSPSYTKSGRLEIEDGATVLQQILIGPKFVRATQEALNLGKEDILVKGGDEVVSPIDGHIHERP